MQESPPTPPSAPVKVSFTITSLITELTAEFYTITGSPTTLVRLLESTTITAKFASNTLSTSVPEKVEPWDDD